ncbi:MAG: MBOAT family O-acyltransferase [Cyanobacteria bacterium P01_D01_bin.71]
MLFNSPVFIFFFLPATVITFLLLKNALAKSDGQTRKKLPIVWLIFASLFFYGWWNIWNLAIILTSVVVNYSLGILLNRDHYTPLVRKALLFAGITANILAIAYYKYAAFLVVNFNSFLGQDFAVPDIVLPIAISFFTFQQIAYLVDAYKVGAEEKNFVNYIFFITFFPQLIAGPIVHHSDVLPQLSGHRWKVALPEVMIGSTVFIIGLFKKVIFADNVAQFATPVFSAASENITLTFSEAWVGALAYTLQLYFDFSGYSDMAIGLAFMFGIRLPINFFSPYQAVSIIDFWRRWHITLSNFLRDYLYIPLGGNRRGIVRRNVNLMITMLLGGLWHGAGWTFIFWGGLHGFSLIINHQCRFIRKKLGHNLENDTRPLKLAGWALTFLFVVIAWVYFRADSFATANTILFSMFGMNGIELPSKFQPFLSYLSSYGVGFEGFSSALGIRENRAVFWIFTLAFIAFFMPNTQEWMGKYTPVLNMPSRMSNVLSKSYWFRQIRWQPGKIWALATGLAAGVCFLALNRISEFLYFQF